MTFYTGEGYVFESHGGRLVQVRKRINLIDSIGFCDSHLDPDEVYRIIKEQITSNTATLHKVVIVTSGRIEAQHKESIEQVLKWLNYDPRRGERTKHSFFFVYTRMDGKSDEQKSKALSKVCDRLGASTARIMRHFLSTAQWLLIADIKDDYDKLMFTLFDIPTSPVNVVPRSMCLIM